jgi:hypothetical protein
MDLKHVSIFSTTFVRYMFRSDKYSARYTRFTPEMQVNLHALCDYYSFLATTGMCQHAERRIGRRVEANRHIFATSSCKRAEDERLNDLFRD